MSLSSTALVYRCNNLVPITSFTEDDFDHKAILLDKRYIVTMHAWHRHKHLVWGYKYTSYVALIIHG